MLQYTFYTESNVEARIIQRASSMCVFLIQAGYQRNGCPNSGVFVLGLAIFGLCASLLVLVNIKLKQPRPKTAFQTLKP